MIQSFHTYFAMRFFLLFLFSFFAALNLHAATRPDPLLAMSVVKIVGHSSHGKMSFGSGVVVAPNQVVTNCHVIHSAHSVSVIKTATRYQVISRTADPELDLCLLHLNTLALPSVKLGDPAKTNKGDTVFAYGYPNAVGLSLRAGEIKKLHPFRSSYIIEIDIGIRQGASGGGLFNAQGQLIGLTTFYRPDKGGHYYAIPIDWLDQVKTKARQSIIPFTEKAFWQLNIAFAEDSQ